MKNDMHIQMMKKAIKIITNVNKTLDMLHLRHLDATTLTKKAA